MTLLGSGCAYGARFCTSTAVDALVRIDYETIVTLRNRFNGAFAFASTAVDAL